MHGKEENLEQEIVVGPRRTTSKTPMSRQMIDYKKGLVSKTQLDSWVSKAVENANKFKSDAQIFVYILFAGEQFLDISQLIDNFSIYVGMGSHNRPLDHLISALLSLDFESI